MPRELAHRALPVLGGVADVVGVRPDHGREALAQPPDHLARVVDAERGLGDEGDALGVRELEPVDVPGRGDEVDAPVRVADRALDLGVAGVADQHDLAAFPGVPPALDVDLADERAGGVDDLEPAALRLLDHAPGDPVGAEDHDPAGRHVAGLVDEHGALGAEILDDGAVVDDLVPDVDRRPVQLERPLDHRDGAGHAGAKAPRLGKNHPQPGSAVGRRRRRPFTPARCRPHGPYQNVSGR